MGFFDAFAQQQQADEEEKRRQALAARLGQTFGARPAMSPAPVEQLAEAEPVAAPVAAPVAVAPPAPGGFAQAFGQRPRSAEDLALDARWKQSEDAALTRSGYGQDQGYGWGEALRDIAPVVAGVGLDAAFNKGRGIPTLAVGGAQAAADQAKLRAGDEQQSFENALAARHQRDANQQFGFQQQVEARRAQQYDDQYNADSPQAAAYRDALIKRGVPAEQVNGLPLNTLKANTGAYQVYFKHAFNPELAGDAKNIAAGRRQGTLDTNDAHFGTQLAQQTQLSGQTAAAGTQARINTEVANQEATNTMAGNKAAATALGSTVGTNQGKQDTNQIIDAKRIMTATPQLEYGDPDLLQQGLNKSTKDVQKQITSAGRIANIVEGFALISQQRNQLAQDVAAGRIGVIDAAKEQARLKKEWDGHETEFAGAFQGIAGTQSDKGDEHARKLVPSYFNPLAESQLKGLWGTANENIKANLGIYNVRAKPPEFVGGDTHVPAPKPTQAPSAPKAAAPRPPAAGKLPFAGSYAEKQADGSYKLRDSDGKTRRTIQASQLQIFIDGGGKVL